MEGSPLDNKVRIGVIGCGDIAFRRYLPGFAEIPDQAEITAVFDLDRDRLQHAAAEFGGRACTTLDELLSMEEIDAVLNLTPPRAHGPVTLTALQAGKHVMVEKPLAGTVEEADTLIAEATARLWRVRQARQARPATGSAHPVRG